MPAPQQSRNPVYKETSNIPRPRLADHLHHVRGGDNPGAALAKALGVGIKKFAAKHNENKAIVEAQNEQINIAHAQIGLEEFNREQSTGTLDLITGDFDENKFDAKRGSLDGASFSGELRDKYMEDKLYENTDQKAFSTWMRTNVDEAAALAKAKGPSYYAAWVKEVGSNSEQLGIQYANHVQDVLGRQSQTAMKERMKMTIATDQAVTKAGVVGGWMKRFLASESAGNWNAWFGNSQNKEDLSQLTLGEIYQRQQRPGNDAAGLIQIVPGTLKGMMKNYGYSPDTKFTPQVQTEMALILMKEKGLDKWLRNEISDGQMADRLASVWAGLKTSKGRGHYDGDGVNKGHQDHAVTAKQLAELRYLLDQNPELKAWVSQKGAKAGEVVSILNAPGVNTTETAALIQAPQVSGLSEKAGRDIFVELYQDEIDSGRALPSDDEIEALGSQLKLSTSQRDAIREQAAIARQSQDYQTAQQNREALMRVDKAIKGDVDALEQIKGSSPKTYKALVSALNGEVKFSKEDLEYHTEQFMEEADYGSAEFPQAALKAFVDGRIDKSTYTQVMQQHEANSTANNVLGIPAIRQVVERAQSLIPEGDRKNFRSILALEIASLAAQHQDTGGIPPISAIMETVNSLAQQIQTASGLDNDSRMSRTTL